MLATDHEDALPAEVGLDSEPPAAAPRDPAVVVLRRWGTPFAIYLASRTITWFAALAATWIEPTLGVRKVLTGWDAGWYIRIAEQGYPATTLAEVGGGNRWGFFPGWPAAIRVFSDVTGTSAITATIVLSFVFGAVAAVLLWELFRRLASDRDATFALALVCCFPSAYALSIGYTESMFLMCAAGALLAVRTRRWWVAAVLIGVACTIRNTGPVLCLALLTAMVADRKRVRPVEWLALPLSGLPFVIWLAVQRSRTGDAFAFSSAQDQWGYEFRWFTTPLRSAWRVAFDGGFASASEVVGTIALGFVVVGAIAAVSLRRSPMPPYVWVYTVGAVLVAFSAYWPTGMLRYVLVAFPLLLIIAQRTPDRLRPVLLGACAGAQGVLALVLFEGQAHWQTAPLAP